MTCPHCQDYHCSDCKNGHFPWDEVLRLTSGSLTPGAAEVLSLAGIENPFGRAAQRTLRKLAGLTFVGSMVQRTRKPRVGDWASD
ncbi:MAG TPA: hypothetical protein VGI99_06280 [Gemmataceae bacterium]|jgi:hypothetical protein